MDGILTIVGVGLIGGSVGLAVREKRLFREVRGTTRRRESLDKALAAGAIDRGFLDAREAAAGADMVVVATSVSSVAGYCVQCAEVAATGALITDVGSVKGAIEAAVRPALPVDRHFIGSHPLAGSDRSGVTNARADLLSGATCIITPPDDGDEEAARRLSDFWQALGMRVFRMDPARHDAILATVSHLPHLVAAALVASVPESALPFGASGLRDTTRIAGGDATLWRDIVAANAAQVLDALDGFRGEFDTMRGYILRGDYAGLEDYLAAAAGKRARRFKGIDFSPKVESREISEIIGKPGVTIVEPDAADEGGRA